MNMAASTRIPTSQLFSLRGKTVIATGGTGGLGLEMCVAMAESGADIVSIHLPNDPGQQALEQAVQAAGRKVSGFVCDVGNSTELRTTFVSMWEAGVVPDVLLNCAGLNRRGAIEDMTDEKIDLGGVLQLTKAFSNEWAQHGIQVNCICPGYFKTPLAQELLDKYPEMEDYIVNRTPAGRWGDPADLRGTVIFLASHASDFVTGTSIVVDGGMMFR